MTKIAIISQPEQGVLIDVDGCSTLHEATQHLTATLQVSSEFWEGQNVDLNLGNLVLLPEELAHIVAIFDELGVIPRRVFSTSAVTRKSLELRKIKPASGLPASIQADGTISGGIAKGLDDRESSARSSISSENSANISGFTANETGHSCTTSSETSSGSKEDDAKAKDAEALCAAGSSDVHSSDSDAAVEAQEKTPTLAALATPPVPQVLYLRQTLRAGQTINHKGHLVIVGDVNPGAEVTAEGDIVIWGALRGVAHAGVNGNTTAVIRALKFEPIQLRIATAIARSPDRPRLNLKTNGPETARIVNGIIRISSSAPE